jgi:uncharacterized coiled-coil protein SlyX
LAQNSAQNTGTSSVADDLKALREAIAQQQQQIAQQQQQMVQQQQELDKLQKALDEKTAGTPHVENAALHTPAPATVAVQDTEKPKESPLSFRIGGADFTPGGFVDFENIFRSTNTTNVAATSFGSIPYSNTVQGHLTEFRSTGQYSRYNLTVTTKFGANNVKGYIEGDFNGSDPGNVFITSNSHTNRLRLYWLDLKRGKWEFLGGQTWGLQTPNRIGVSPSPSDLSLGYQEDAGIGVGYNYTRAAEFRAAYHFNDNWVWAAAVQNPQQFVGAGEVLFPFAFNAQLAGQFDNTAVPGAPNATPDFLTKFAYDHNGAHHFHFEFGGVLTNKKITILPNALGSTFHGDTMMGGGIMGGTVADVTKTFRFVAQGMWGYGIGRYLNGLAPDAIVVPFQTGATTFDARISGIHSGDFVGGFEWLALPKTQLAAYYGGMYAQRNAPCDVSSPVAGTCAGKPFTGFGGPNSSNAANRSVQQGTFDWTQTFWRNPQYGAVLLVTQYSYVTRSPWFVPAGAPKNAHLSMAYVSLRYVLP